MFWHFCIHYWSAYITILPTMHLSIPPSILVMSILSSLAFLNGPPSPLLLAPFERLWMWSTRRHKQLFCSRLKGTSSFNITRKQPVRNHFALIFTQGGGTTSCQHDILSPHHQLRVTRPAGISIYKTFFPSYYSVIRAIVDIHIRSF